MNNLLSKYTERLATQKAKAIDDFISDYVPKWQFRVMLKFPFTVKLFGWTLERRANWSGLADKLGEKIELKRWGKLIATLTINETVIANLNGEKKGTK